MNRKKTRIYNGVKREIDQYSGQANILRYIIDLVGKCKVNHSYQHTLFSTIYEYDFGILIKLYIVFITIVDDFCII